MAHHPSPSPSGGSGSRRLRLSEVLREQQEPFSLDLYLLEKGCSPAFLDACGGGACSTCWPRTISSVGRTPRRPARRKKGSRRGSRGVLRLLLSKILSGKAPAATRKRQHQPAAIDWRHVVEEERRTPDRSELHGSASRRGVVDISQGRVEEENAVHEDEDEDEAPKKQLSPVSVLEQRLFEHSPPPPHAQKALAIFSELLEAAYTPAASLLEDLLAHAKDEYRSSGCSNRSKDGRTPPPPRARKRKGRGHRHRHAAHREREEEGLGRVSAAALVASSEIMGGAPARVGAADPEELWAWAQDVAAAVLDALTEETAAELMLHDGDGGGGGGDGPRLCG